MALKIKKKKNNSEEEIKISNIGNEFKTQKGFKNYKKNIKILKVKGYKEEEIKRIFKNKYLTTVLNKEDLKNKLREYEEEIEEIEKIMFELNEKLFDYLFNKEKEQNKIKKEKVTKILKIFNELLENNKEDLDIKLYSAYRKEDGAILTLYDRLKEELKIYYNEIKINQETSLSNLFAILKTMSFITKEILTEKNIFLLGSIPRLTNKNRNDKVFINTSAQMNYGHGLETLSAMNRIKENSLSEDDIKQLDISEWNNFYKFHASEAQKLGIIQEEDTLRSLASADLIETTKTSKRIIEIKHYSENIFGNLNIYLKRPQKMLSNFKKITEFAKILGKLSSKETGGEVKGEALYDITIYTENEISKQLEITMEDYTKLFLEIGEKIAKTMKVEEISKNKIEIMIGEVILKVGLNGEIKTDEEDKQEYFSNKNIFAENNYVNGITNVILSFEDSEDFVELIKKYGGIEKNIISETNKELKSRKIKKII